MWEAIAANRRRSRLLILLMGLLLLALGFVIGMYVDPQSGGPPGMLAASAVWLVMTLTALGAGDRLLLASVGAKKIEREDLPLLWNVVEEMTLAAGLGKMPAIYLLEDDAPNAFAVGRKSETAAVAVTSGLLRRLTRDELQGVVAHEIGHVSNLDVRFMTLAGVMMGSIILISDVFLRSLRHGGGRSSSRGGKNNNGGQAVFLVIALVLAILAPIVAQLLYFACSREREYLADASAARFTRYPAGLAAALEKIAGAAERLKAVNRATAPMFIINPLQAAGGGLSLFSTHPPTEKRVAILRAMGGGAGYGDYAAAFHKITGDGGKLRGEAGMREAGHLDARAAQTAPALEKTEAVQRSEAVHDVLARMGQYVILPCPCGMKLKLPPEYKSKEADCPRCGRRLRIPQAMLKSVLAGSILTEALEHEYSGGADTRRGAGDSAGSPPPVMPVPSAPATAPPGGGKGTEPVYHRRGSGWESFQCTCGQALQLSPGFSGDRLKCGKCGTVIGIEGPPGT